MDHADAGIPRAHGAIGELFRDDGMRPIGGDEHDSEGRGRAIREVQSDAAFAVPVLWGVNEVVGDGVLAPVDHVFRAIEQTQSQPAARHAENVTSEV